MYIVYRDRLLEKSVENEMSGHPQYFQKLGVEVMTRASVFNLLAKDRALVRNDAEGKLYAEDTSLVSFTTSEHHELIIVPRRDHGGRANFECMRDLSRPKERGESVNIRKPIDSLLRNG
jgi:hypothetical protein